MNALPESWKEEPFLQEILLDYILGTLSSEAREEVEAALLQSPEIVGAYLALKRTLASSMPSAKPSPQLYARLRHDIQKRFAPTPWQRLRHWLQTPIPLYQSLCAFFLVLLLTGLTVAWGLSHKPVAPQPTQGPLIDSTGEGTEQLDWG